MLNNDDELSPRERAALASLPREIAPSDLLEERVVHALRDARHFAPTRSARNWTRPALRVAAAIALFAGGVATGRYLMKTDSTTATAPVERARSVNDSASGPHDQSAQTVINTKKVVAEREMWL